MDIEKLVGDAVAAFKARNRKAAVSAIEELVAADPDLGQHWGAIARMAATMLETKLAKEAALKFAKHFASDPQQLLSAAGVLAEVGYVKQALDLIEPIAAKDPKSAPLNHFVGMARSQLGDAKGAEESLRKALAVWPNSGHSWLMLAAFKHFEEGDEDLAQMVALKPSMASAHPSAQAPFYYALGKALLDVGDRDAAMVAYAEGAAVAQKDRRPFDPVADRNFVDGMIGDHTAENFATLKPGLTGETRPIFVIGLPRSGTTLMEQILTSHPDVEDGAELNFFTTATMDMGGLSFDHIKAYEKRMGDKNAWHEIGDTYLHLMESRYGKEGRIIDKSLNNSRYLGLIRHVFPDAPILWIRRDPLDAAWSCYRTYFNIDMAWSCRFDHIAKFFMAEDALYHHWSKLYPDAILTVPYEALVSEPDVWFEKILNHAGLSQAAEVKDFHKNERAVLTASVAQVRKPIHKKSIGLAAEIGEYMKDFTDIYS